METITFTLPHDNNGHEINTIYVEGIQQVTIRRGVLGLNSTENIIIILYCNNPVPSSFYFSDESIHEFSYVVRRLRESRNRRGIIEESADTQHVLTTYSEKSKEEIRKSYERVYSQDFGKLP